MHNAADGDRARSLAPGDDAEFERRLLAAHPRVVRFVFRLTGWRQDVDEIVQEVFAAAWQGRGKFRGQCLFETWVLGIAVNKCRRWRFRAALVRKGQGVLALTVVGAAAGQDDAPGETALGQERSERVRAAVRALPVDERELIVLRYLEQLPAAEICQLLGISAGALDVRLHRARKKLEILLEPYMSENGR